MQRGIQLLCSGCCPTYQHGRTTKGITMLEKPDYTRLGIEVKGRDSELFRLTRLAMEQKIGELGALNVSPAILEFSLSCVGENQRKGGIVIDGEFRMMTTFAHMVRVAYLVQTYFPEDKFSRVLASVHDIKEEAMPTKKERYKQADRQCGIDGVVAAIELLTEEEPTDEEIGRTLQEIPAGFDPVYIAKYRNFISRLRKNWLTIGSVELCDRWDGAGGFDYLFNAKYDNRRKFKALESFSRIWATIRDISDPISEEIKGRCQTWLPRFEITETEVTTAAKLFFVGEKGRQND